MGFTLYVGDNIKPVSVATTVTLLFITEMSHMKLKNNGNTIKNTFNPLLKMVSLCNIFNTP